MYLSGQLGPSQLFVHVGVGESPHEGVGTDHFLGADAGRELGVAAAELVDLDLYDVDVVVELDEPLQPLSLVLLVHHLLQLLLDPLHRVLDGQPVVDGGAEHADSLGFYIVGQIGLDIL